MAQSNAEKAKDCIEELESEYKAKIIELEEENDEMVKQICSLEEENNEFQDTISELEERIEQLKKDLLSHNTYQLF